MRDTNGGNEDREPEVPARMARRRDLICRSMGEEYTDGRHKIIGEHLRNYCAVLKEMYLLFVICPTITYIFFQMAPLQLLKEP